MARNKYDIDESLDTPFDFSHLKRSLVYVNRYKIRMILAFLLSIVASLVSLCGPRFIQKAIDEAMPSGNMTQLLQLSGLLAGTIIISLLFNTIRSFIMVGVGQDIIYDIRSDLFRHLQELPFSYYDSRPQGKILVRVVQYVNAVSDMLSNGIVNIIIELLNIVFNVFFNYKLSCKLSIIVSILSVTALCIVSRTILTVILVILLALFIPLPPLVKVVGSIGSIVVLDKETFLFSVISSNSVELLTVTAFAHILSL